MIDESAPLARSLFWRHCQCGHVSGSTDQYSPCGHCGKESNFFHFTTEALDGTEAHSNAAQATAAEVRLAEADSVLRTIGNATFKGSLTADERLSDIRNLAASFLDHLDISKPPYQRVERIEIGEIVRDLREVIILARGFRDEEKVAVIERAIAALQSCQRNSATNQEKQ